MPDGATDRSLLAKSDDIGKKLIFLGSRNSRALKCRTQGKLCYLPQSPSFQVWGRRDEGPLVLGIRSPRPDPEGGNCWSGTFYLVLYPPSSYRIGPCLGQRRDCVIDLLSLLQTAKRRPGSIRKLASDNGECQTCDSEPGFHILSPYVFGLGKETKSKAVG